ncbi:MAG: 4-(cytidine 5'-diphospho)-2-C-methyl-D-erythritol kinase [Treponema sp.]|nr:4-(cytidine 5'-diphospho)-2-C-methyl-D-erythritol kinase [Treponema sp.]
MGVEAPCKINLHLRVKDRRSDGYHDLESLFLALAFGDTLRFELLEAPGGEKRPGEGLYLDCTVPPGGALSPEDLPPERNIVRRAVSLFRARTGFDRPLRVRLEKRIPLGAGLGGGSSDAASTLLALNELAETALSGNALEEMAGALGSDVPFFIRAVGTGGAAFVSGRGERIRSVPGPGDIAVALVNPGFPSGTADAFRLLDRRREDRARERVETERPGEGGLSEEGLIAVLQEEPSKWPYGNDFLPVFLEAGSERARRAYGDILGDLKALGADFAGLSGAGSTCFGVFIDRGVAKRAVNSLRKRWNFVLLTFPLARWGGAVLEYY